MLKPLKRKKKDGTPYERPLEIELWLKKLEATELQERIRQFAISSRRNVDYVPTEALIYFLRRACADSQNEEFERIFTFLMKRVEVSLHSNINDACMTGAKNIREEIMGRFAERIAKDCVSQSLWLDFYEVRFDKALVAFRVSALREIGPSTVETVPLTLDESDNSELAPEVEDAATDFLDKSLSKLDDPPFRSALMAAIDELPNDQKQVIGLLLQDIPIDSKDPDAMTISRILGCTEKTVRNRRDRAFKILKVALQEEWMQ